MKSQHSRQRSERKKKGGQLFLKSEKQPNYKRMSSPSLHQIRQSERKNERTTEMERVYYKRDQSCFLVGIARNLIKDLCLWFTRIHTHSHSAGQCTDQ